MCTLTLHAATSDLVGKNMLRTSFGAEKAAEVSILPQPLMSVPGHLLFSRKQENGEALVSAFNRGPARLRKSGQYDAFLADLFAGNYNK